MPKIGDIIERRSDGTIIYMSNRGLLCIDNTKDLEEAQEEDAAFLEREPK